MPDHTTILRQSVESYMARHRLSARRFGQLALRDPGFVAALIRGRSLRLDTADRLLIFMGHAPIRPHFQRELNAFLQITRMKPYMLGIYALGDPSFTLRLRAGRSPRLKTIDRVRNWMYITCNDNELTALRAALSGPFQDPMRATDSSPSHMKATAWSNALQQTNTDQDNHVYC